MAALTVYLPPTLHLSAYTYTRHRVAPLLAAQVMYTSQLEQRQTQAEVRKRGQNVGKRRQTKAN